MVTRAADVSTRVFPERPPARRRPLGDRQIAAISLATAFAGMFVSGFIESFIIRAVGATGHQLEWISDLMAAFAVSTLMYLWLHLRGTRLRLLDSERAFVALDEQFRIAAEIQRNLLPEIPAATAGYRWAARMEAAHQVGGDFYDFLTTPDGAVLVIIGDVSGKGMPAALLQSSVMTLFRVHASITADPCTIATRMSEGLRERTGGKPYATAIVARVDRSPRRITYVNAGHPPGAVLRGAAVLELDAGGPPLGLLPSARYASGALDLLLGDLGVLVTDGVTEAVDNLPDLLRQLAGGPVPPVGSAKTTSQPATPTTACDYLLRAASHGPGPTGEGTWTDDRTVFAFGVWDGHPE
jgi:hypothetical protein